MIRFITRRAVATLALFAAAATVYAQSAITMASTTSTEQSGLFGHLLPEFNRATGIDVKVVAVGTGQAIDSTRRGDADVLFVHDQMAEEKFVADALAAKRYPVMYNDFVVVGPKSDPVSAKGSDIVSALKKISAASAPFISRGDKSGTHAAELRYWKQAGLESSRGSGYKECGCGMGPALNMSASLGAYVLTDRGTWLSFKNRGDLTVLVEGDKRLFNQYGVMAVSQAKHPHVRGKEAQQFVDWIISTAGQSAHRRVQDQRRTALLSERHEVAPLCREQAILPWAHWPVE